MLNAQYIASMLVWGYVTVAVDFGRRGTQDSLFIAESTTFSRRCAKTWHFPNKAMILFREILRCQRPVHALPGTYSCN